MNRAQLYLHHALEVVGLAWRAAPPPPVHRIPERAAVVYLGHTGVVGIGPGGGRPDHYRLIVPEGPDVRWGDYPSFAVWAPAVELEADNQHLLAQEGRCL